MKRSGPALLLGLALVAPGWAAPPLVVGHRGTGVNQAGNPFPENSLPAIRRGFAEGADLVEIDVQLDADGVVLLWHDDDLKVAGRPGVRTRDLRRADFPPLAGAAGPVPVPRFRDALALALELAPGRVAMDVEIKLTHGELRDELCAAVAQELIAQQATTRVLVSSFDLEAVRLMERLVPGIESGYLVRDPRTGWDQLRRLLADPEEPRIEWLLTSRAVALPPGPEALRAATEAQGVRLGVWTVNRRFELFRLARAGLGMLITDEPDRAVELLR